MWRQDDRHNDTQHIVKNPTLSMTSLDTVLPSVVYAVIYAVIFAACRIFIFYAVSL
jgi:hypothetical protein